MLVEAPYTAHSATRELAFADVPPARHLRRCVEDRLSAGGKVSQMSPGAAVVKYMALRVSMVVGFWPGLDAKTSACGDKKPEFATQTALVPPRSSVKALVWYPGPGPA